MSTTSFPWFGLKDAEQVTRNGRKAIEDMVEHFTNLGYEPVIDDVDGYYFKLPSVFRYTEENPYIDENGNKLTGYKADAAEYTEDYLKKKNYETTVVANTTGSDGIDHAVLVASVQSNYLHDLGSVELGAKIMRNLALNAARVCCEHYASGYCMGGKDYTYQEPEDKGNCWEICKNGRCPFFKQLLLHIDNYYYEKESWQDYYHEVPLPKIKEDEKNN